MRKKFFAFGVLIILVIALVSIPLLQKVTAGNLIKVSSVLLDPFSSLGSSLGRKLSFFSRIRNLNNENKRLADQLISLRVDQNKIAELEKENTLLKNELGFVSANKDLKLLPSRVIGREPTSFLDHLIIDKGKADGVTKGMAVISSGVLVGQVKEAYDTQSEVTLVTSKDSMILSMLQDSRAKGLLTGGIAGLTLQNIAQDVNYTKGENVITSGLDGELRPGLLIGKTQTLESSTSDLFKNIAVEPAADLSKLEMVFIIQ